VSDTKAAGNCEAPSEKAAADIETRVFLVLGILLALVLRFALLGFESGDYGMFLSQWYDFIKTKGFLGAFRYSFSNYPPLYLHLLAISALLPIPKLYAVKLVSVVFDFVAAAAAYKIVRKEHPVPMAPAYAFLVVLFTPTVFLNGAFWGQCDVIYCSMILISLYCLARKRHGMAFIAYGLSFAFKLQSVFILPVYVLLWLRKEFSIRQFLWIPLAYLMSIVPSLLVGRPLLDLLTIYLRQAEGRSLTMQAPNFYQWLPRADRYFAFLNLAGIALAASVVLVLFFAIYRGLKGKRIGRRTLVQVSLLSALVVPFFLPQMHERYFFLADVLSIVYAFYHPQHFFVPIVVILSSMFSYFPFLFRATFIELPYVAVVMFTMVVFVAYDVLIKTHRAES